MTTTIRAGQTGDILELLNRDHQEVTALLGEIEGAGEQRRELLFARLVGAIEVHAQAEEDVFYGTLDQRAELEDILDDARQEHDEIDHVLEEMDEVGAASDEWIEKLRELRQMIRHHVDDEEHRIFAIARELFGPEQLLRLGEEFLSARAIMRGEVSGEMPAVVAPVVDDDRVNLERMSKKELYLLAQQREIGGRSNMTREELLEAIRSAR